MRIHLLAWCLALTACAAPAPRPAPPVPAPLAAPVSPPTAPPSQTPPVSVAPFRLLSAPAAAYGVHHPDWPEPNALEARLEGLACAALHTAEDAALRQAAREVSRYVALSGRPAPEAFQLAAMRRMGLSDPIPAVFVYGMKGEAPSRADEEAMQHALAELAARTPTHVGVGVFSAGGVRTLAVLAVTRSLTLSEPIPAVVNDEHRFSLAGTWTASDKDDLTVYLDFMDERVFEAPLALKNGRFRTEIQVPQAPAVYEMEIVARRGRQAHVAAAMTFYNHVEPPTVFDVAAETEADIEAPVVASRLEDLVREARLKAAQTPLIVSEALRAEATAHAEEMLAKHYVAAVDRQGRTAEARLKRRGLEVLAAGELADGAYGATALAEHLAQSPSLKGFVTRPALTHIGCGVAGKRAVAGRSYAVASCLVATLAEPGEEAALESAAAVAFDTMRREQGFAAFTPDPELVPIARAALDRLLKAPEQKAAVQADVAVELERHGVAGGLYGYLTFYSLAQLRDKSIVNQLVQSSATHLTLVLRKVTAAGPLRGLFLYYIAY